MCGTQIPKIVDCIWTSKARYGIQLYGETRKTEEDSLNNEMNRLQLAQIIYFELWNIQESRTK